MANRSFDMIFQIGGRIAASFNNAFNRSRAAIEQIETASQSLTRTSGMMAKGLLAAGGAFTAAAVGVFAYTDAVAQADIKIKTLSDSVGANAKEIEYLGAAISPLGLDFEAAIDLQEEFLNKWGESRSTFNAALKEGMDLETALDKKVVGGMKDAYAMLGLDIAESLKMSEADALKQFQDAVLNHSNNAEAQSASDIMMGGNANKFFGFFRSQGIKSLDDVYKKFGALDLRTDESRKALQDYASSMSLLKFAADSVKKEFIGLLSKALTPLIEKASQWVQANKDLIGLKIKEWAEKTAKAIEWVVVNFKEIVEWTKAIGVGMAVFIGFTTVLKTIVLVTAAWNAVLLINPIVLIVTAVAALAGGIYFLIQRMGGMTAVWEKVKAAFASGVGFLKGILQSVDNFFAENPIMNFLVPIIGVPRMIIANWSSISSFFATLWENVKQFTSGAVTSVVSSVSNMPLLQAFTSVWERIFSFLSTLGTRMMSIGANIIDGLIEGIKSKFESLKSTWNTVNSWMPDFAKKKLDIHSPSRVMAGIGGHIVDGLGVGINSGFPSVQDSMNQGLGSLTPRMDSSPASIGGSNATLTVVQHISVGSGANLNDVKEAAAQGIQGFKSQYDAMMRRQARVTY